MKKKGFSFSRIIFIFFILSFFSFLVLILAISIGSIIAKGGQFDSLISSWIDPTFYKTFSLYFGERISVHYYSFAYTLSESFRNYFFDPGYILDTIRNTLFFRGDVFSGNIFDVRKPEISSLSRINFLLSAKIPISGEGTSPGLFASMNYMLPLPIAIFFSALFLNVFAWVINNLRFSFPNAKLTYSGCVMFYFFTKDLFFSPFDLLIIFDEGVVFLLLFLIVIAPYFGLDRQKI